MEDIVEKFLADKLDREIKNIDRSKLSSCKMLMVHEECEKLKNLIEEKAHNTRREKLYYLLNVMTEWHLVLDKQSFLSPSTLKWVEEVRGRLKQIEKDLRETTKVESRKGGDRSLKEDEEAASDDQKIYRWSSHAVTTNFHGFEDMGMTMERLLLKEGSKVIEIVGVAGVGKTALCQQAFNDRKVQKHFTHRIWLCLSMHQNQHADPGDDFEAHLMKRMLSCLGFDDEVRSEVGHGGLDKLKAALQQQLNRGKYLIILDDVWKREKNDQKMRDAIQNLFSFYESETKHNKMRDAIQNLFSFLNESETKHDWTMIVTSRYEKWEENSQPKNLYRLKLLRFAEENSCWEIYRDAAAIKEIDSLKSEIVNECQGLPLMAKMLGEVRRHQQETETRAEIETQNAGH